MGEDNLGAGGKGRGRIDDIEVLRAFAVGLVLLQHAPWNLVPWQLATVGPIYSRFNFWSGVDLFFAISGFVIARSLLPQFSEVRTGKAFLRVAGSFWVRRAWRLLPTAWVWLAVMLVLAAVFNRSGVFDTFASNVKGAIAAVFYFANFQLYEGMKSGHAGTTSIYWTLSIEEQFYAVLPFLVFFSGRWLPLVLALIAGVQLASDRTTELSHILLNLTRSDALALGVLLAMWSGRASYRQLEPAWLGRGPWRYLLAPLFLLVFAYVTGQVPGLGRFKMTAITLLSVGMVWVASYDRDLVWPAGRVKQVLCWMGARSYAIYLIHLPMFHATVEFWSRVNPQMLRAGPVQLAVLLAIGLSLTFGLAELNYRFLEVPLRRHGVRMANRILNRGHDVEAVAAPSVA